MQTAKCERVEQADNAIVIITDVQDGTRGDISSARKLIKALRTKNPNRSIVWLLRTDGNVTVSDIPDKVELIQINDWVQMFEYSHCVDHIKSADFVAVYPAYLSGYVNEHRGRISILPVPVRVYIEHCREGKLPLNCILEYGYMSAEILAKAQRDFPRCHFVQTGVMQNSCGIFIEDYSDGPPHRQLLKLPTDVKRLLGAELIEQGAYFNNYALFVGYYNRSKDYAVNNNISAVQFIHIITELSVYDINVVKKTVLDVMLPFSLSQMSELNIERLMQLGFSQVYFQTADGVTWDHVISDKKGKSLRITQLPTMSEESFRALVAAAHPFVMCTGDQSLGEVLSKSSGSPLSFGLPYYQIMSWKLNSFMELCEQVKLVCGDEDNSHFTLYLRLILFNANPSPELLGDFLGKYSFWWDSQKFTKYLRTYFDLSKNLPTYIEACISERSMLPLYSVLREPNADSSSFLNDIQNNEKGVSRTEYNINSHAIISLKPIDGINKYYKSVAIDNSQPRSNISPSSRR